MSANPFRSTVHVVTSSIRFTSSTTADRLTFFGTSAQKAFTRAIASCKKKINQNLKEYTTTTTCIDFLLRSTQHSPHLCHLVHRFSSPCLHRLKGTFFGQLKSRVHLNELFEDVLYRNCSISFQLADSQFAGILVAKKKKGT